MLVPINFFQNQPEQLLFCLKLKPLAPDAPDPLTWLSHSLEK